MSDELIERALRRIEQAAPGHSPRVALILGSGWGAVAAKVQEAVRLPYAELPGFPGAGAGAGVGGHAGELVLGELQGRPVALLAGRVHTFENDRADNMAVPLRTLRRLGCEVLIQTNAAGSLNPRWGPGTLMLIDDHINMAQRSPLVGLPQNDRFVSMTDAYSADLRRQAKQTAKRRGLGLQEGVYMWFLGPQFETPAEIRMFQKLGASAVGMSTVPETIIARHAGMKVLAISMLTNMAAGLSNEQLSHAHTLAQASAAGDVPGNFLAELVGELSF